MCAGRVTAIVLLVYWSLNTAVAKNVLFASILCLHIVILWLAELSLRVGRMELLDHLVDAQRRKVVNKYKL